MEKLYIKILFGENMETLLKFIDAQYERLKKYYDCFDDEKFALASMAKLSEEVGELSEVILAKCMLQHKKKKEKKHDLPQEIADVLIVTLIIAKHMKVDVKKALEENIKNIEDLYKE
jgi:NTP pyrophosphatase (non-canonical NTP hydrolase)